MKFLPALRRWPWRAARYGPATAVLLASIACGLGPTEPDRTAPAAPAVIASRPETVLIAEGRPDGACDWSWRRVPGGSSEPLATAPCGSDGTAAVSPDGRVLLVGHEAVIDLTTRVTTLLPALPTVENGGADVHLGVGGHPIVKGMGGYGAILPEGGDYEHTVRTVWGLAGDHWEEQGTEDDGKAGNDGRYALASEVMERVIATGSGPGSDQYVYSFQLAHEDVAVGALNRTVANPSAGIWDFDRATDPRIAWFNASHLSDWVVRFPSGAAWVVPPGLEDPAAPESLQGDFVVVRKGEDVVVYDLRAHAVLFTAQRAFFWPRDAPDPRR